MAVINMSYKEFLANNFQSIEKGNVTANIDVNKYAGVLNTSSKNITVQKVKRNTYVEFIINKLKENYDIVKLSCPLINPTKIDIKRSNVKIYDYNNEVLLLKMKTPDPDNSFWFDKSLYISFMSVNKTAVDIVISLDGFIRNTRQYYTSNSINYVLNYNVRNPVGNEKHVPDFLVRENEKENGSIGLKTVVNTLNEYYKEITTKQNELTKIKKRENIFSGAVIDEANSLLTAAGYIHINSPYSYIRWASFQDKSYILDFNNTNTKIVAYIDSTKSYIIKCGIKFTEEGFLIDFVINTNSYTSGGIEIKPIKLSKTTEVFTKLIAMIEQIKSLNALSDISEN